ncbi:MAG: hypothetical protein ACLFVQ_08335 [Chitinispirillaceae bacterium]
MNKNSISILFLICISSIMVSADELTVVLSGETHAMLHSCDCPEEPGGGLAQRAYLLKSLDSEHRLLLDAGGFAAGGIYDTYTQGRANDSLRTVRTVRAMGEMGYDAVAVGDDDLQYGGEWLVEQAAKAGLPLVSANSFKADGTLLTAPYLLVRRGDETYGITSVVTNEKLLSIGQDVAIGDPSESLKKIWKELEEKSDHQIVLSHLGEEETVSLLKEFPGVFIAGNGHRKVSSKPFEMIGETALMNFGFQGKALSYVRFSRSAKGHEVSKGGWLNVERGLEKDSTVAALLSEPLQDEVTSVDLYIMSQCPYGIQALGDLVGLLRVFPDAEWNLWFIGEASGNELSSLNGEEEIRDEMLWLAVEALYPSRYGEFLYYRASSQEPTETVLDKMELDGERIASWVEGNGKDELKRHYLRSMRLKINASPTVYINNAPYEKSMGKGRLVWEECRRRNGEPEACGSVPECLEDADCRKEGKLGSCEALEGEKPKCVFSNDAQFLLTVVVADSVLDSPEEAVVSATVDLLPGAQVEKVRFSSGKGQRIVQKYKPQALPFFVFDKAVEGAHNFSSIQNVLLEREDGFVFRDGAVKTNFFPLRPEVSGVVELLVDPLMPDVGRVLDVVLNHKKSAGKLSVRPLLLKDPALESSFALDKVRREESVRWLLLSGKYPGKFLKYLKHYSDDPASTFWFRWLEKVGIRQKKFVSELDKSWSVLGEHWERIGSLAVEDPVVLLVDNRMLVTVSGERDLEKYLDEVFGSK